MSTKDILEIPYGTKDILPGEARAKRIMEDKIAANFTAWGYDEVATPTFEYLETFSSCVGNVTEESIKFFDRNNRTLILRSDMTTPLARMVATRLKDGDRIKRLSYIANIFRHEETQAGRQCEFGQAGVELMGAVEPEADAEVIALAITSLKKAGLDNFVVSLGHIDFLTGLMEAADLSEETAEELKKLVLQHDAVGLEKLVDSLTMAVALKKIFKKLLFLHGGEELLKELLSTVQNEKSVSALRNLAAIYELAKAYKVEQYIRFDLSLIRDFDYYTGMVFEVYTAGMGFPICGGGRYDNMMESFGTPSPATGFAMGIDRIMLVLERQNHFSIASDWDVFVAWDKKCSQKAIAKTLALRQEGKTVKLAVEYLTEAEAVKEQKLSACKSLVYVED